MDKDEDYKQMLREMNDQLKVFRRNTYLHMKIEYDDITYDDIANSNKSLFHPRPKKGRMIRIEV